MNNVSNCIECDKALSGKQRSFCSVECKNKHYLGYDALKKRALTRKSRLVNANGGGCSVCGYSVNIDALSFYDQNGKTLHIDINVLANSNYDKLANKLQSAQILCRNCVEEIQNPVRDCHASSVSRNDVDLKKNFADNLTHRGVKSGQTIVLGVSGGVDSVTMLDLFAKSEVKLNIIVAHMNHGVRAEASQDEILVKNLAQEHGFKYYSKSLKSGPNMTEEYLRNERRKFLLSTANNNGADYVALAHNADDQAETFIMNAVRGSGPAGLGAMSMSDKQIIRPLLNFSRAEIEYYARTNNMIWNEDATNKDVSYSRNYVRHRILPLLSRLNPEYLSAIHRTTYLQRQIDDHLKEEAWRIIYSSSEVEKSNTHSSQVSTLPRTINIIRLRRLDKPLLYEVLGLLYEETKGDRQNLTLAHLSAIEQMTESSSGTKSLDLPGNIVAKRNYDRLDFCAKKEHNTASAPSTKKLKLGTQKFGAWKLNVSTTNYQSMIENTRNDLIIDAETLPSLTIRRRNPGDKIASIGKMGTKKLQDLFVDAKIDRDKRDFWPIITNKTEILWVPGLAKVKFQLKTKKLLKINIVEETYETSKKK